MLAARSLARRTARPLSSKAGGFLASIDQGTSSSRVILYDTNLKPLYSHQVCLETITPHAGWTQMDPMVILSTVETCAAAVLQKAGATASDVLGIGITNQRETTVVWDKRTGAPLYDAILWHDGRTSDVVQALRTELGGQDAVRGVTGLPISTYFSASKLRWLIENVPEVREGLQAGTALVGTIDSWLIWNLTGGAKGVGGHDCTCDESFAPVTLLTVSGALLPSPLSPSTTCSLTNCRMGCVVTAVLWNSVVGTSVSANIGPCSKVSMYCRIERMALQSSMREYISSQNAVLPFSRRLE